MWSEEEREREGESTESLFCSPHRSQNQERGQRGPFVFYLLCRDHFLCGPSSASQSVPRQPFHLTIPRHHHRRGSALTAVRDFLCARVNTFYGKQKTLNYRAAYYVESLGSNARIRSKVFCMTMETARRQPYTFLGGYGFTSTIPGITALTHRLLKCR